MKHEAVALAFIAGTPAKNHRINTDGQSVFSCGCVIATKADDGLVILATYRTRSGSIMRAAVQRAAYSAQKYTCVRVRNGMFPETREALLKLWKEDCDERASIGMSPLIFNGTGQP